MPDPWEKYAQQPAASSEDGPWAKYGGGQGAPATPAAQPESHPVRDFIGNFAGAVDPRPAIMQAVQQGPIETAKGMYHAQADQFRKAGESLHEGGLPGVAGAVGHGMAGLLPVVGPAAADAGEQIGNGDVAGGLGKLAGTEASIFAPEAGMKGLGKALRAPAPAIAETAMGVRNVDRAFSRTPGRAILDETHGVRPGTIAASAQDRLSSLNDDIEKRAANSPAMADLTPARNVVAQGIQKAAGGNSSIQPREMEPMRSFLHEAQPGFSGAATSGAVDAAQKPMDLLRMRRTFGNDFVDFQRHEVPSPVTSTANQAYHAMGTELENAIPGADELNRRMSNLIPVAKRAKAADLNASTMQRMMGRVARPTGAFAGGIAGAMEGGRIGGIPGALTGGLVGIGLPEMLSSPTVQMTAARGLEGAGKGIQAAAPSARAYPLLTSKDKRQQKP